MMTIVVQKHVWMLKTSDILENKKLLNQSMIYLINNTIIILFWIPFRLISMKQIYENKKKYEERNQTLTIGAMSCVNSLGYYKG